MATNKEQRRARIKKHIRKTVVGTTQTPRLCVFRSNSEMYAQIIDDTKGHTLVSASSRSKSIAGKKGTKSETAKIVGTEIAQNAVKAGITSVVFDRNGFLYHGRVKALAEGAREAGLKF